MIVGGGFVKPMDFKPPIIITLSVKKGVPISRPAARPLARGRVTCHAAPLLGTFYSSTLACITSLLNENRMIVDFSDYGVFTEDDEDENTRSSKTATEEVHSKNGAGDNDDRGVSEGTTDDSDDINWSSDEEVVTERGSEVYRNEGTSCHPDADVRDDCLRQEIIQPLPSSTILNNEEPLPCIEPDVKNSEDAATFNQSAPLEVEVAPDFELFSIEQLQSVEVSSPGFLPSLQGQVGGSNSSNSSYSTSEDERTQLRGMIIAIRKDSNLTEHEKRVRIQLLMDKSGTSARASGSLSGTADSKITETIQEPQKATSAFATSSSTTASPYDLSGPLDCPHYDSNCRIVAPCCNKIFGCRVCHDEAVEEQQPVGAVRNHGPLDRYSINQIVCKQCGMLQNSKT
jgi:hypothetical protein